MSCFADFIVNLGWMSDISERLRADGPDVCKPMASLRRPAKLLILVDSEASNKQRRHQLRSKFHRIVRQHAGSVRVAYFVGKSSNKQQQKNLLREQFQYNDMVLTNVWQPASAGQHYRTIKAVSSLKWLTKNCVHADFVLKIDESLDVVHLRAIEKYMRSSWRFRNSIWSYHST